MTPCNKTKLFSSLINAGFLTFFLKIQLKNTGQLFGVFFLMQDSLWDFFFTPKKSVASALCFHSNYCKYVGEQYIAGRGQSAIIFN